MNPGVVENKGLAVEKGGLAVEDTVGGLVEVMTGF